VGRPTSDTAAPPGTLAVLAAAADSALEEDLRAALTVVQLGGVDAALASTSADVVRVRRGWPPGGRGRCRGR
jgi:hypothetical protein